MKIGRPEAAILALLCLAATPGLAAREYTPLLTGEVFSRVAQEIFAPHTPNWRVSISRMENEGQPVLPGDVVVAFDGTETMLQIKLQREQRRANEAVAARDLAQLTKEVTEARFAVEQARVAKELADLKAGILQGLIGALEYAEYQLASERAARTLANAEEQFAEKQQSLEARRGQADLDRQKADLSERWWQEQLERLTITAQQPGYVIHANHPWTGAKFQEGESVHTSFRVAEVADTADLAIRVWVHGVDRPHIEAKQPVTIIFDALPGRAISGQLESLSDSASKRPEWGDATYFEGTVSFDAAEMQGLLLPGMSALIEVGR